MSGGISASIRSRALPPPGQRYARHALPAPVCKMGGVEPLPAQESADPTGLGATVGFGQCPQLVLGGELTAHRLLGHLGIRRGVKGPLGLRPPSVPTTGEMASSFFWSNIVLMRLPPSRPQLDTELLGGNCLTHVGTQGLGYGEYSFTEGNALQPSKYPAS